MSAFVEVIKEGRAFELCGRIIREGDLLVIFIDEIGKFTIPTGAVIGIIMGLGDGETSGPIPAIAYLSPSGKGFYLNINDISYVIPVSRVKAVIAGKHRKGPVSRMI
jgi:hypothetical protein